LITYHIMKTTSTMESVLARIHNRHTSETEFPAEYVEPDTDNRTRKKEAQKAQLFRN
jgi:hypothetical protein